MIKKIVPILMLSAMVLASCAVNAQAMGGPLVHKGNRQFADRLAKDLSLTKEQHTLLLSRIEATNGQLKPLEVQNRSLVMKMEAEMQKDAPDKQVVDKLIEKIGQNDTQMRLIRTNALLDFISSLSKEQQDKFKAMIKKRGEKMKHRSGLWMRPSKNASSEPDGQM